MPTEAEKSDQEYDPVNSTLTEHFSSWTDDLPLCRFSGVGTATNQVFRVDGARKEEHEFEDRSFHFCVDEDTFFYGVFDGHNGCRVVEFASQRMPAEILLGQLKGKENDKEIKDVLQQAFLTVETTFFQSIDGLLAEKETLRLQLQGFQAGEASDQYSEVKHKLAAVESEIASETAAVVALIYKNRLYIANVGSCRAVLCKEDATGSINVYQLTVDHNFHNEDEILRMSQLGIAHDVLKLKDGDEEKFLHTRCIGNYTVKGGYKEFNNFREAIEEPVIVEPEVVGGIELDSSCKFLFLMSGGLCKSLEQVTGTKDLNDMIARMLEQQLSQQSTLNGVAQAVVDECVRLHQDSITKEELVQNCQKREDITLMIRIFNQQLQNDSLFQSEFPKAMNGEEIKAESSQKLQAKPFSVNDTLADVPSIENTDSVAGPENFFNNNNVGDSISTSSGSFGPQRLFQSTNSVSLDNEGRIKPYVDFSDFYELVEEAYQQNLVPADWRRCNS